MLNLEDSVFKLGNSSFQLCTQKISLVVSLRVYINVFLGGSVPGESAECVWARVGYPVRGVRGGGRSMLGVRSRQVLLRHRVYVRTPPWPLLETVLGLHQSCLPIGKYNYLVNLIGR